MHKYITDFLRNNLRSVVSECTRPQQKAIQEVVRGLFVHGTPILRHLAQDEEKSAKKQGEKYAYHLGNVDLKKKVEAFALRRASHECTTQTIIAYDLTDISKEHAEKMEKLSRVHDGSRHRVTNGYVLHGVGMNGILTHFEVHNDDRYTRNQIRGRIVAELSRKLKGKGIWVFDRGNDDKAFFWYLSQVLHTHFIARVKENRQVVLKETGVRTRVRHLKPGRYVVYLMTRNNDHVETRKAYTLIISQHLQDKEPIRLLTNLSGTHSKRQVVSMYLERWGVENMYRRVKEKFDLEKIRVLDYRRFVTLVALIQFALVCATVLHQQMQRLTSLLLSGVLQLYKVFLKRKALTSNVDSFLTYLRSVLKPFRFSHPSPPFTNQLQMHFNDS